MQKLSILSYNTHLFWKSIAASVDGSLVYKDSERLNALVDYCNKSNYDIIGLSEVWGHDVQNQLKINFAECGMNSFAFQGEAITSASSGLFLAFRGQVDGVMSFDYYYNLVGPDKLSAKGVVHGVLKINGVRVYVIQTHTQASYVGTEARDDAARKEQIMQTLFPIIDTVKENYPDLPIFLLGDLNIVANSEQYEWFAKRLNYRGFNDAWVDANGSDNGITYDPRNNLLVKHFDPKQDVAQRIDYIFYTKSILNVKNMRVVKWKTDGDLDLSDHYGVDCFFG